MVSFMIKARSGFHSFKGIPENTNELNETISFFLEKQEKFDGKKLSRQRITNLRNLFEGLAQTIQLAKEQGKKDLLEEVEIKSKELESYNSGLETEMELVRQFESLMAEVVKSSDRFIIKAKKVFTGAKSQAVLDLEKFLSDNNLKSSDFDENDMERLKRYEVNFV